MIGLGLQIQEQVRAIDTIELVHFDFCHELSVHTLMVITILQYCKNLSDREMIQIIGKNAELRGAIGIPNRWGQLASQEMCEFRFQVNKNQLALEILDQSIARLAKTCESAKIDLATVSSKSLLDWVCMITRVDKVHATLKQAIEAITILDPGWMSKIALPYWFFSHSMSPQKKMTDRPHYRTTINSMGADIEYLLQEIEKSGQGKFISLLEIQQLQDIWAEQYEYLAIGSLQVGRIHWRTNGCTFCDRTGGGNC